MVVIAVAAVANPVVAQIPIAIPVASISEDCITDAISSRSATVYATISRIMAVNKLAALIVAAAKYSAPAICSVAAICSAAAMATSVALSRCGCWNHHRQQHR